MAEFVVNIALLAAVLVLLAVWGVSARRRRRRERRERVGERRLILAAFTGAAATPSGSRHGAPEPHGRATPTRAAATGPEPASTLDAESVAALLDLLEDRRAARHGVLTGLLTSPRSVWSAGTRAGRNAGRRTTGQRPGSQGESGAGLYREAASELVEIHRHDPADAHEQYSRYAVAIGDPALAELYVRSAAYATYAGHEQASRVVEEITGARCPVDTASRIDAQSEQID